MLYNQYEGEQEQLQGELDGYRTEQVQYENDRKSAARLLVVEHGIAFVWQFSQCIRYALW